MCSIQPSLDQDWDSIVASALTNDDPQRNEAASRIYLLLVDHVIKCFRRFGIVVPSDVKAEIAAGFCSYCHRSAHSKTTVEDHQTNPQETTDSVDAGDATGVQEAVESQNSARNSFTDGTWRDSTKKLRYFKASTFYMVRDVASEVYLRLSRYPVGNNCFPAWSYRVSHNCVVDYLRKRRRFKISLDEPIEGTDESTEGITLADIVVAPGEPIERI